MSVNEQSICVPNSRKRNGLSKLFMRICEKPSELKQLFRADNSRKYHSLNKLFVQITQETIIVSAAICLADVLSARAACSNCDAFLDHIYRRTQSAQTT